MNQYGSSIRTLIARNILTGVFSTGNSVIIPPGVYHQCFEYGFDNLNVSNFNLLRVGLSSNFVEGLVMRYPDPRMDLTIRAGNVLAPVPLVGTASQTGDIITGIGTAFLSLSVGGIVYFNGFTPRKMFIRQIYDDLSMQVSDYQTVAPGSFMSSLPAGLNVIPVTQYDIGVINHQHECQKFVPVSLIAPNDQHIVYATIDIAGPGSVEFLTQSINPDFTGEMVMIDVVADFEITL